MTIMAMIITLMTVMAMMTVAIMAMVTVVMTLAQGSKHGWSGDGSGNGQAEKGWVSECVGGGGGGPR